MKKEAWELIAEYACIFAMSNMDFGKTPLVKHSIRLSAMTHIRRIRGNFFIMRFFRSRTLFIAWFFMTKNAACVNGGHWNNIGVNPAQYRNVKNTTNLPYVCHGTNR